MSKLQMMEPDDLNALIEADFMQPQWSRDERNRFCERFHQTLCVRRGELLEAMQCETGFVTADCCELLEASLDYVASFGAMDDKSLDETLQMPMHYEYQGQRRHIRLGRASWGTVAVILPQNAFLLLAVTCLLNGLAAGNRVLLRAPQQSAHSAELFAAALSEAQPPTGAASVLMAKAKVFVEALYSSPRPCLLHYLGSSGHAPQILSEAFTHGKGCLIDGEGNGWAWVGEDADPDEVAALLTAGATRYNGQTCTSFNGALIHPALYDSLRARLISHWNRLKAGDPRHEEVSVGQLFDEKQAEWCKSRIESSGGLVLCGGKREGRLLSPTLIECPNWDSELVREGLFCPALWIAPVDEAAFCDRWAQNRYPLCASIFSPSANAEEWLTRLGNLARLTLNGDSSVEYLFEPWGGYPASGSNPVGHWKEKYQRVVQIDALA